MKPEDIEVGKTYLRRGKSRDRDGVLREWEHRRRVERITGNGNLVFRETWEDFSARRPGTLPLQAFARWAHREAKR
jgi:hypothetical protein